MILRVLFLIITATSSFAQSNSQGSSLLDAFQGYCPEDYSVIERRLAAQTDALIRTVNYLKQRPECQFDEILDSSARSFSASLSEFEGMNEAKYRRLKHEKNIVRYTQMIDSSSYTSAEVTFLENEVFNSQLELVKLQDSDLRRFTSIGSRAESASRELLTGVNRLLQLNQKSPDCYGKGQRLATIISATAASASAFLTPTSSLAINGISQLGVHLAEVFRNRKYNKVLQSLNDDKFIRALQCSSLTLSRNYCDADNSLKLIDKYNATKQNKVESLIGVDLLGRRLVNTDEWLKAVVSGSVIRQEGDFDNWKDRQEDVDDLRIIKKGIDTFKFEIERDWSLLNQSQLPQAYIQGIESIMFALGAVDRSGFPRKSPALKGRNRDLIVYQLIDPSIEARPFCPLNCDTELDSNASVCQDFSQYISNVFCQKLSYGDWALAIERAKEIVDISYLNAQAQLTRVRTLDPETLFFTANFENGEQRNVRGELDNVASILTRIKVYLLGETDYNQEHIHFDTIDNIDSTILLTKQVEQMIESGQHIERPLNYPSSCKGIFEYKVEENGQVVSKVKIKAIIDLKERTFALADCISQVLELDNRGNLVYFNKLKSIVQYELETRLKEDSFSQHVQDILLVSRRDLVENLRSEYQGSLAMAKDQLNETKEKTKRALQIYWSVFGEHLTRLLTKYNITGTERKSLCMRALTFVPVQKDNKIKNIKRNSRLAIKETSKFLSKLYPYCKDVTLNHYADGPTIKWADYINVDGKQFSYSDISEEKRLCITDIYSRRVKVFESRDMESY